MSRGRSLVLLLNNPFVADSRSWKIASSLAAAGWTVTVVARARPDLPAREARGGFETVRIEQPRPPAWLPSPGLPGAPDGPGRGARVRMRRLVDLLGRAPQALRFLVLARAWAGRIAAVVPAADVWQAEGLITLPVALRLRRRLGGIVVYDSRDLHVESAGFARLPGPWRRLLAWRERRWVTASDAVITANRPYAAEIARTLGVVPDVVYNGPVPYEPPKPPERRFHEALGLPRETRVALIVSAIAPHRGIEQACEAVGAVPDTVLAVVGDGPMKAGLEASVRAMPHADRVRFLPAVPPEELPAWTAAADVAVIPIQPATLNHRLTTPTRLFDAMGAGVPVVAADLPGMAEIVRETGCGVLCDPTDPAAIAAAIAEVLDSPAERRHRWREAGLAAARGTYAWARQAERLIALYERAGVAPAARAAGPVGGP